MPRLAAAPTRTTLTAAVTTTALALTLTAVPSTQAQVAPKSTGQINNATASSATGVQRAYVTPDGTTIQIMGDLLGPYSRNVGLGSGDLGAMAPIGQGEYTVVFGDSFSGRTVYQGQHFSPVGVVASTDDNGFINIKHPMNEGTYVKRLINYTPAPGLTLLPSDIINVDGKLYLQAMWNQGLHNVTHAEIFSSTNGANWKHEGRYRTGMSGLDDLISWAQGPDGMIYIVATSFTRSNPVFLFRATPENIAQRSTWEIYNANDGSWGGIGHAGTSILDHDAQGRKVKAGEMNLRYIDGHWVLAMFNEATLSVEVRISRELERDWNSVPAATIAKHGPWKNEQTPMNWSQPYGGYIVPGSSINDMDIVVSQWNTGTHDRYMSTQFNVKGLEKFFGLDIAPSTRGEVTAAKPIPELPPAPQPTVPSSSSSGSSQEAIGIAIALGVLATVVGLVAFNWPMLRQLLPESLQQVIPF